ncbi:MAG TPA: YciI-like protein [Vicinamibacterales bacterium]|nr:YciI-like protein [Vicinamibacterales bacterium]
MQFFALSYDVVPNFAERRMPVRETHLRLIREAHDRGLLVLAGAVGDPPDGALLVFRADSALPVEDFARADPYVREGLVTAWRVRPWHVVIGAELAAPPRAL